MDHANGQQEEKHESEPASLAQAPDGETPPPQNGTASGKAEPDSHSGLGITSSIIAGSALLLFVISIICLMTANLDVLATVIHDQMTDEELTRVMLDETPLLIVGTFLLLLASFLTFIGAALGLAGLFQPDRKRLFAILGTLVNGVCVLFFLLVGLTVFFSR